MKRHPKAWKQIGGDVNALVLGGLFVREDGSEAVKIFGPDFTEPEAEFHKTCEVYYLDPKWHDPLSMSWVRWDEVLRYSGETRTPSEMSPIERICAVADYQGWHEFTEPHSLRPCDLAKRFGTAMRRYRGVDAKGNVHAYDLADAP